MRCFFCGGVYHEATGHLWTPEVASCGPCFREWLRFFRGRLANPSTRAWLATPRYNGGDEETKRSWP